MVTPALRSASILSSAPPLPPAMIAPAWPMRRPGGARLPAINPTTGFLRCADLRKAAPSSSADAADLADHDDRLGLVIGEKHLEDFDKIGAVHRVAADADAGRLPEPDRGRLRHRLIGQGAGARDDADPAAAMDVPRHDADLALVRGDDAGAVRADQPGLGRPTGRA